MIKIRDVLNLTRLHTAGWESLMFVLGPILVGRGLASRSVALLACLGLLINAFIFVVNDLADLPRDRLDPAKERSPLVSGSISLGFALALALVLPLVMWMLIAIDNWPVRSQLGFILMLALGAWLCVNQKTMERIHPVVLDCLFAVTMAAPVPVSIEAIGEQVSTEAWLVTWAIAVLTFMLNSVGGNLKDLESDLDTGFRTSAIAFGVRVEEGRVVFTRAYGSLLIGGGLLASLPIVASGVLFVRNQPAAFGAAALGLLAVGMTGMNSDLWRLYRGRRPPHPRGRERFFFWGMGTVFVVVAFSGNAAGLATALFGAIAWEAGFRWYWARSPRTHREGPIGQVSG